MQALAGQLEPSARLRVGGEVRYNGVPSVGVGIVKQQKASTVDVAKAVRAYDPGLPVLGLPKTAIQTACASAGLRFTHFLARESGPARFASMAKRFTNRRKSSAIAPPVW